MSFAFLKKSASSESRTPRLDSRPKLLKSRSLDPTLDDKPGCLAKVNSWLGKPVADDVQEACAADAWAQLKLRAASLLFLVLGVAVPYAIFRSAAAKYSWIGPPVGNLNYTDAFNEWWGFYCAMALGGLAIALRGSPMGPQWGWVELLAIVPTSLSRAGAPRPFPPWGLYLL